jgi:Domain of unknown function (DUF4926)
MLKEYDTVVSKKRLSTKVPHGTFGTILIIHIDNPLAYVVEFVERSSDLPKTLDILTVRETDVRELSESEKTSRLKETKYEDE